MAVDDNNQNIMTTKITTRIDAFVERDAEWEIRRSEDPDPQFSFNLRIPRIETRLDGSRRGSREPSKLHDAFEIRDAFFAIKEIPDADEFFDRFGPWQVDSGHGNKTASIRFSTLLEQRDFYRDALLSEGIPRESGTMRAFFENLRLWQNLPMELVLRQPPVVLVRCNDIQDALRATVFLAKVEGLPWRLCARVGCLRPFEVQGRRTTYCSDECGHLQSSNAYNWRKRRSGSKAKASAEQIQVLREQIPTPDSGGATRRRRAKTQGAGRKRGYRDGTL
jgi:hypothetical protein